MSDDALIRAAAVLKHSAFPQWELFMAALKARRDKYVDDCVDAGPDSISIGRAQGRSRELKDLLVLLQDADKTVAKLQHAVRRS